MARPRFAPTPENRKSVLSLIAVGVSQEDIAAVLGIDAKTLRKHFHPELSTGATKANCAVAQRLYQIGMAGNVTALIFWLKCRAGWKEWRIEGGGPHEPPPSSDIDITAITAELDRLEAARGAYGVPQQADAPADPPATTPVEGLDGSS